MLQVAFGLVLIGNASQLHRRSFRSTIIENKIVSLLHQHLPADMFRFIEPSLGSVSLSLALPFPTFGKMTDRIDFV